MGLKIEDLIDLLYVIKEKHGNVDVRASLGGTYPSIRTVEEMGWATESGLQAVAVIRL